MFNIDEIATLIESLYTERNPDRISQIQSHLQSIQKSNDGIHIADILISNPKLSLNCKFFGALTYTVCLNHVKTHQDEIDPYDLLLKLFEHTVSLINDHRSKKSNNLFIIKKLLSNIALLFIHFKFREAQWEDPLKTLIMSLITGSPPLIHQLNYPVDFNEYHALNRLDDTTLSIASSFSSILVEELLKIGKDNSKTHIHRVINKTVYYTTEGLLKVMFDTTKTESILDALNCFHSWISYISFAENNTEFRFKDLNTLFFQLFIYSDNVDEEIFGRTIEILTDVFENNPLLVDYNLREKFQEKIASTHTLITFNNLMAEENFDELNNYASFIIAFLEIDLIVLTSKIMRDENSNFLELLLNLTNFPLAPIMEEELSKKFVEFWCQIIEIFIDDMDMLKNTLKNEDAAIQEVDRNSQILFEKLSVIYFNKIQFTVASHSDFKQDEAEFLSFRNDTVELFDLIYTKLGPDLFQSIAVSIQSSDDINAIETGLFILTSISMNFSPDNVNEKVLISVDELFNSNFLSRYNDLVPNATLSNYYVKSSIKFLGAIEFYYKKKGTEILDIVIGYLFESLKNFPEQQFLISRTILEICDGCRSQLTSSIGNFEPILVEMIRNPEINNYTREKFINSISCIIQSLPDPSIQESHVFQMIELIESTSEPFLAKAIQGNSNSGEIEYLTSLFSCILEIAKGLSIPDDLSEEEPEVYRALLDFYQNYDQRIQIKTSRLINIFATEVPSLVNNKEIIEKASLIYKCGLLEEFGPFAFPNEFVLQYALKKNSQNITHSTLITILEVLTTLLNTGFREKPIDFKLLSPSDSSSIIQHFIAQNYETISQDPDLLQIALGLLTSLLTQKPGYLIHDEQSFVFAIQTAFSLLFSKEKFVIKAASNFWTTFLSGRKRSKEDAMFIQNLVENDIGQTLTLKTFQALLDASRSDVDSYSKIIVVLFAKYQLPFKTWLEVALANIDESRQANGKKAIENRELFIKKFMVTRGATRKCNELIKDFWITTNGMISYN